MLDLCVMASPEHQAEVKTLLLHQVTPKPIGASIGQKDDTLGETVAGAVHVGFLQSRLVRRFKMGHVLVHKQALLPQTSNGADVVKSLA